MGDKRRKSRGSASQRFLVRYDHEAHVLFVDVPCGPLLDPDASVYMRVRRLADTYRFSSWESTRGDLLGAHFALKETFFSLPEPPKTLVQDTKWLALASGAEGLASIDLWWVAVTGHAVAGDCPGDSIVDEDPDS